VKVAVWKSYATACAFAGSQLGAKWLKMFRILLISVGIVVNCKSCFDVARLLMTGTCAEVLSRGRLSSGRGRPTLPEIAANA